MRFSTALTRRGLTAFRGESGDWRRFLERNHDRLDRRLLAHCYCPETLASSAARRVFILGEFRDSPYGA